MPDWAAPQYVCRVNPPRTIICKRGTREVACGETCTRHSLTAMSCSECTNALNPTLTLHVAGSSSSMQCPLCRFSLHNLHTLHTDCKPHGSVQYEVCSGWQTDKLCKHSIGKHSTGTCMADTLTSTCRHVNTLGKAASCPAAICYALCTHVTQFPDTRTPPLVQKVRSLPCSKAPHLAYTDQPHQTHNTMHHSTQCCGC